VEEEGDEGPSSSKVAVEMPFPMLPHKSTSFTIVKCYYMLKRDSQVGRILFYRYVFCLSTLSLDDSDYF